MKRPLRNIIAINYCIIFYVLLLYRLYNGLFLIQMQPLFIYTTQDVFAWLFMQTGISQWALKHTAGLALLDAMYYTAPLFLLFTAFKKTSFIKYAAVYVLMVNWLYIQCYTLYPTNSITLYIAWLIFPITFIADKEELFCLLLGGVRYFFLYFFFSAGVWKVVQGGVFNSMQLSSILLEQHKELLTNSPRYWVALLLQWIIDHNSIAYCMYILVTITELSFIVGFFTKRFDNYLMAAYLFFLVADHLIMRILYYETLPFLLTFYLKQVDISANEA